MASSSPYRYIVFPPGKQPTHAEADALRGCSELFSHRIAFGANRRTGALAIAFEAETFDRVLAKSRTFADLVSKWEVRGCETVDHLAFIKDPAALRPVNAVELQATPNAGDRLPEIPLTHKELAAREATARSRLQVDQTLQRIEAISRFGTWVPYLLVALATISTLGMGYYIHRRLSTTERAPRKLEIEQMLDERLKPPPTESTLPVEIPQR